MGSSIRKTKKHVRKNKRSSIKKKLSKTRKMVVKRAKRSKTSKRSKRTRKYRKKARGGKSFTEGLSTTFGFSPIKENKTIKPLTDDDIKKLKNIGWLDGRDQNYRFITVDKLKKKNIRINVGAMGCDFTHFKTGSIPTDSIKSYTKVSYTEVCDTAHNFAGVASSWIPGKITGCFGSGLPNLSLFFLALQALIRYYLDNDIIVLLTGHSYGGVISNQIAETNYDNGKLLFVRTTGSPYFSRSIKIPEKNVINIILTKDGVLGGNELCALGNDTVIRVLPNNNENLGALESHNMYYQLNLVPHHSKEHGDIQIINKNQRESPDEIAKKLLKKDDIIRILQERGREVKA